MFSITPFFHSFRDWLLPNACAICHRVSNSGIFCTECFSKIAFIDAPYCRKCGKQFTIGISNGELCTSCVNGERIFDVARSLLIYNYYVRQIVVSIKQTGDRNLVSKCCELLEVRYKNLLNNIEYIVPVPSHWFRTLSRGFNPADVIAYELCRLTKIPISRCLKRIRMTKYQHKMSKSERIKNVSGAFVFSAKHIINNVLLVDDVFTTGATLNECSKALRYAGTTNIHCLTLASTEAR